MEVDSEPMALGLDADGLHAMLTSLLFSGGSVGFSAERATVPVEGNDVWFAQLVDDALLEDRLRYGMAISDNILYTDDNRNDWAEMMASWLIPYIAGVTDTWFIKRPTSPGISDHSIAHVATLIMRLLKTQHIAQDLEEQLVKLLFELPRVFEFDIMR